MTITITTSDLPVTTAGALPADVGSGRPDDADSLRLLLSWAREEVWPGAEVPPWWVEAWRVQLWPVNTDAAWNFAELSRHDHAYPAAVAAHILRHLASAAVVVAVEGDDGIPGEYQLRYVADLVPTIYQHGYRVRLPSWEHLSGGADTAALWRWSAADRTAADGRRTARDRDRALAGLLPAALATAQAMHDALAVLLPQAVAQTTPTAPTPRRNQWR